MPRPSWPAEQLALAIEMRKTHTVQQIADYFGVQVPAVGWRLARAGVSGPSVNRPWTDAEDAQLRELHAGGATDPQVAAQMERSEQSVFSRRRRLRIVRPKPEPKPAPVKVVRPREEPRPIPLMCDAGPRQPLPAGHPTTWGILLALTPSLENIPYRPEPR